MKTIFELLLIVTLLLSTSCSEVIVDEEKKTSYYYHTEENYIVNWYDADDEPKIETHTYKDMWTVTEVRFRQEPTTLEDNIIEVLHKGTKVTAINYNKENLWTEIKIEETTGYVSTEFLSEEYISYEPFYTIYAIKGSGTYKVLDPDLQKFVQDKLEEYGMEDYFPYFICQCWQESRFKQFNADGTIHTSPHGKYGDIGIMQIYGGHTGSRWQSYFSQYPNWRTSAKDNIGVALLELKRWYNYHNGDIIKTIGSYYSGNKTPNQKYIDRVLSHMKLLVVEDEI